MQHGTPKQTALIKEAIEKANGMEYFDDIMQALKETKALEYTKQRAMEEADKAIAALSLLPESEYKQALVSLAHIAADRTN
jgi:octaprenyl-diphosphate synthase